jgi:hypothetical protein
MVKRIVIEVLGMIPNLRRLRCGGKKHSADAQKSYQKRWLLLSAVTRSSEISNREVLPENSAMGKNPGIVTVLSSLSASQLTKSAFANSIPMVGLREAPIAFAVDYGRVTSTGTPAK